MHNNTQKEKNLKQKVINDFDAELEEIISKRISSSKKVVVVGTGITSSHLGDERNIREFLIADALVKKLRSRNHNVIFYLFDDSYDPLNFRQLRVAVNKDEKLIKKFEKYCGMPISLIPDPYECHSNYSAHYQSEILKRFHGLDIYPNIIDIYGSYQSGLYDKAKEIVFTKHKEIRGFLSKQFPGYTMKKLFYPLCPNCLKIDGTDIKRILNGRITVECAYCENRFTDDWKNIKGKLSWKIDLAVKWNLFKIDFEPYSKAYLDPDVGSYFIAKKLSKEFFGGHFSESVNYGQVIMDKSLSYRILPSFPRDILNSFFINNRKKDFELTDEKLIQVSHTYKVDEHLTFNDYVLTKLPFDMFEIAQGKQLSEKQKEIYTTGLAFAKNFLKRDLFPQLPTHESFKDIELASLVKIQKLFKWAIEYKYDHPQLTLDIFLPIFTEYLKVNRISKKALFPLIRTLLSQEHSLSMYRIFFYSSFSYLGGSLVIITQEVENLKRDKFKISPKKSAPKLTVQNTL